MLLYRCPNRQCRRKYSLRPGSFFEKSALPIYQQLGLIVCWWNELRIKQSATMVGISPNTATTFFKHIRTKIVNYNIDNVMYFNENGGEYEVDECWHKCCWVAGIIERHTRRYFDCLLYFLFGVKKMLTFFHKFLN